VDQEKIWNCLQTEGIAAFSGTGPRFRFIAKQILAGARVLNIGIGNGNLEAALSRKGADVFSVDPSEAAIRRLQDSLGERAQVGYSQSIPFADSMFDAVVMTEVLEHLEQGVRFATFGEVKRVLNPHGRFIGTVPADEILEENRVVCPHCAEVFHRYGHAHAYSQETLRAELLREFRNVSIERRYFADFGSLNWKGRLSAAIKTTMVALRIPGTNENFYFSASNGLT
jgi:2-polyprenyl-3-methyl-5-hydroxy-6-metoxy-1,4-benzoquinol methylase